MKKFTLFLFSIALSGWALAQSNIVITEIMYNPPETNTDTLEFVELYNNGSNTVDLSGYYFNAAITYTFPNGTSIAAGAYVLVASDSSALANTFGVTVAGEFRNGTALSNSGEDVVLHDALGNEVDSVFYDDASGWPTTPDGGGYSLVLCDPSLPNADNSNWAASSTATGVIIEGLEIYATPGAGCTVTPPSCPMLYVNEVMASNSTAVVDAQGEYDDWFEIYNPNNFSVDIAGYYVSDDATDLTKFQILSGYTETVIPANGHLLVWCDDMLSVAGPLNANFKLSSSGETISLVCTDGTTVIDSVSYPALNTDESYGRQSDGNATWITFTTSTPNATNSLVSSNSTLANGSNILKTYPNPVENGILYFNSTINGIVYNGLGQVVVHISKAQSLDVHTWQNGFYLIKTDDNKMGRFLVK